MSLPSPKPGMGVLRLREGETKFRLSRHAPSEETGFFVKHFWIVSWDLSGQEPYLQHVVPNPCVNLAIEEQRTAVYGISKHKSSRLLEGKGLVFGIKFKPGGFYPFIKQPVSALTGHTMSVRNVLDLEERALENTILSQSEEARMVELAESFLRPKLPERDEYIILINQIIDRIIEDREIVKVDHICQCFNMNKRKLQRLFNQYVGVSPKWVVRLYRLQNAAEVLERGGQNWLDLPMELGYYDQSHFIKDFKSVIGMTPDEYAGRK